MEDIKENSKSETAEKENEEEKKQAKGSKKRLFFKISLFVFISL